MKDVRHVADLQSVLGEPRAAGQSIGWIGTSGALHDGHLSLIRQAKTETDVILMSWLGNVHFSWAGASNPGYNRDEARDSAMAESAGVDVLWLPIGDELYPEQPFTQVTTPRLHHKGLTPVAHLDNVALFMSKLINLIGGCTCYMGEKDWEQLVMMRCIISDLSLPVDRFVGVATARDTDGVPLSSRNAKLTAEQRAAAVVVPNALRAAAEAIIVGETDPDAVQEILVATIEQIAPVSYAKVVSETLQELDVLQGPIRMLAAADFGGTVILDNLGIRV